MEEEREEREEVERVTREGKSGESDKGGREGRREGGGERHLHKDRTTHCCYRISRSI